MPLPSLRLTVAVLFATASMAAAQDRVNVRDFSEHVTDGNWSPAIQAAIDHVSRDNGFHRGGDVYFPPGEYRIDTPIVLGEPAAHWGMRLVGYGTTLTGSATLDQWQPATPHEEHLATLGGDERVAAQDDAAIGAPILILRDPPGKEGAFYTIEGLIFDREQRRRGIGVMVAADQVPKGTSFRNVKIVNQDVGVRVNYAWQFYFDQCVFRANRIGVHGLNHFNAISFHQCVFRRNHNHGLKIGPNRKQWGSSGISIDGCIFEANKGYGIHNAGGIQVTVRGCYFEANGNAVGVTTPFGHTTIDTCHFHNFYPAEWGFSPHEGKGHIVLADTRNAQLRNNRYSRGDGIFLAGRLRGDLNRFDTMPVVAGNVSLPDALRIASDDGLRYYEYTAEERAFVRRSLIANDERQ